MDAPLYLPWRAYEAPAPVAYEMTTANTSIKRLLASPATKSIMIEEIPGLEGRIAGDQLRPHLDNFSPRSLVQFGLFKAEVLDRVDRRLHALWTGRESGK